MTMSSSDGYNQTATLSNLMQGTATNCKYSHNITVTCSNASAATATGTGQTSFSVDLSQIAANAPKITGAMDSSVVAVANPILKAITDRPADCQYKQGSDFTYGAGTAFDTTGSYNHNAQLKTLASNTYTYYVHCKDKDTCAINTPGTQVKFTVSLSGSGPVIANATPETQTVANPTLSVTTDRPSICQYKKDSTFTYGDTTATQFTNDSDYSHTSSLTALADGKYTFYVACKANDTSAATTFATAIITTLARSGVGPVISNTTASSQTTSNPTLSVATAAAATCQYKKDSTFTYGDAAATQFTTDGALGHSAVLSNLADGTYTYYVVCKDTASGIANNVGAQIVFTVTAGSTACASLSSNDVQNDNDRQAGSANDTDSKYLWRSVEGGTRDKFKKVDWYAGYQFTPGKDGQVTQLCGYFPGGVTNKVSLYNGSYNEIASAQVSGNDDWKCVPVSPVLVKTDARYYVIARVQANPIYFEYQSGLLSRDADAATIDAGIWQTNVSDKFGTEVLKKDYMIFGLVDVRIKSNAANTSGAQIDSPIPVGTVTADSTVISVRTNIAATCKFDRDDVDYDSMKYTFGATGALTHQQKACTLANGPFTFYVRCKATTGTSNASTLVQFTVGK